MRLARYVLFELAVGATLLAGVGVGAYRASAELASFVGSAAAATVLGSKGAQRDLGYPEAPRTEVPSRGYFLGVKDEILTAPLLSGAVTRVKFNRGGSSLSLRLDFADGSRAAFKPDQINLQTVPRKEIAAYRLSRLLGIEAVSPAVGRAFTIEELVEKLDPGSRDLAPRLRAEVILNAEGKVSGELSWWIPIIVDAELDGMRIDSPEGIAAWRRYLVAGAAEPYEARHLLPQISTMLVFDYLINNSDRFSGSNAKASPDGRTLYYMDNTLSFGTLLEGSSKVRGYLEKVQKLSRSLVRRVRGLDEAALRATMAGASPYDKVLFDEEITAVLYRRDQLLTYVDTLCGQYGEAAVMVYP